MDTPGSPSSPGVMAGPEAITLSKERLTVSLPVRVSGRVRLIKYVETETVTQTVEVRKEKLRVEESPAELTGDDQLTQTAPEDGSAYSWQPQTFDLILHEERVEIVKTVVAVEKVKVRTAIHTTDQTVSADLSHEQIELSSPATGPEVRAEPRPT